MIIKGNSWILVSSARTPKFRLMQLTCFRDFIVKAFRADTCNSAKSLGLGSTQYTSKSGLDRIVIYVKNFYWKRPSRIGVRTGLAAQHGGPHVRIREEEGKLSCGPLTHGLTGHHGNGFLTRGRNASVKKYCMWLTIHSKKRKKKRWSCDEVAHLKWKMYNVDPARKLFAFHADLKIIVKKKGKTKAMPEL